jgi:hypothetical protein
MLSRTVYLLAAAAIALGQQAPFLTAGHVQRPQPLAAYDLKVSNYDEGMFTPVEDLHALSQNTYTTLAHPAFPKHSVRIKKSSHFCDGNVK